MTLAAGAYVDPLAAREGVAHLCRVDPALQALIGRVGPYGLAADRGPDHFGALARAIVYQQLAGKVAAVIHARFLALFPVPPEARLVGEMAVTALRASGLSGAKAAALKDLAHAATDGRLALPLDGALSDEALTSRLTAVRGIGPWTAHMFLMFHLGRPDVWPIGDFAIRLAAKRLYALRGEPSPARLDRLASPWRPWRSIASWYLWRSLDGATPA